jgi:hypothetical protein
VSLSLVDMLEAFVGFFAAMCLFAAVCRALDNRGRK